MRTVVALILTALIGIVIGQAGDEDVRMAVIVDAARILALPACLLGAWLVIRTEVTGRTTRDRETTNA